MGAVFGYGLWYERLSHITIGWDSDRMGCGYTAGYEEYPYLYFGTAPTKQEFSKIMDGDVFEKKKVLFELMNSGVCVKECPKVDSDITELCKGNTKKMAARGCDACSCNMWDNDAGVEVPFRYDTIAVGLYGKGFCLPYVSTDIEDVK